MADTADVEHLSQHEEVLQRKEQRLQQAHERRMETEPGHASKSPGKGIGDFFGGLMEHKGLLLGIGAAIIIIVVVYYVIQSNNANSANAAANQSPNLANGGYLPSDISAQLASINDQLSSLGQGTTTTPTNPTVPTPNPPIKWIAPSWVGGTATISQQGNQFFLMQGGSKINLSTLFPTGTTFAGGGGGRAWYTLPGGKQQELVAHGFGVNGYRGHDMVFMQSTPKGLRTISSGI